MKTAPSKPQFLDGFQGEKEMFYKLTVIPAKVNSASFLSRQLLVWTSLESLSTLRKDFMGS